MEKLKSLKKLLIFLLILGISIVFVDKEAMKLLARDYPDAQNTNILIKYFDVEYLSIFFKNITLLGQLTGIVLVGGSILVISFFSKNREDYYNLFIKCLFTFWASEVVTTILKVTVCRERPFVAWNPHHFYGGIQIFTSNIQNKDSFFSFPSGHTTAAFAIFGILYMFSEKRFNKIIFIILPILVAISRIYLGRHFFSDTLTGGTIGYFTATIINRYDIYKIISNEVTSKLCKKTK